MILRRAAGALIALTLASPAAAEIESRVKEGNVVFTSRPKIKPDVSGDAGAPAPRGSLVPLEGVINDVGERYRIDPGLIRAVIHVESAFDPMAVSPKGARGLMQLMPETARAYGVENVHDPIQNLEGGVAYLSDLARQYDGDVALALAAYNAGPTAVERAGGIPRYRETIDYIEKIQALYGKSLAAGLLPGSEEAGGRHGIRATVGDGGEIVFTNRPRRRSGGGPD